MKIIFFSDSNGHHRKMNVPAGDMLICAGNFTINSGKEETQDFMSWFLEQKHNYKIIVSGGQDRMFDRMLEPNPPLWYINLMQDYFRLGALHHLINNATRIIQNITFFGSPSFRSQSLAAHAMYNHVHAYHTWNNIPLCDILITHGAPYGYCDRRLDGVNMGDAALTERLAHINPRLHLFGSVREGRGLRQTSETVFVNGSVTNDDKELVANPWSIMYDKVTREVDILKD